MASEEDEKLINLRQTDRTICCPLRDVKTCDLENGFKYDSIFSVHVPIDLIVYIAFAINNPAIYFV